MVSYTPILKLTQPDFDQVPWDEQINDDLSILDAAFGKFLVIPDMTGVWHNNTLYLAGQVLVDSIDSSIWSCAVQHTSAVSPTTFAQDRAARPTFWVDGTVPQNYLPIGGGVMTGPITLSDTPTANQHAATKLYVDGAVGRAGGPFLSKAGDTATGTLIAPQFQLTTTGANIHGDNNFTYWVQDTDNWYWRYRRSNGGLDYIRGPDSVVLFSVSGTGDVSAPGTITGVHLAASDLLTMSFGVQINSTATYTKFIQGSDLWRWEYVRADGTMRYMRGTDSVALLTINGVGDVTANGSMFASRFQAFDQITLTSFGAGIVTSSATTGIIVDANGYRWEYNRAIGSMSYIRSDNTHLFSIDNVGNVIARGTITGSGVPLSTLEEINAKLDAVLARVAALEAKVP